MKVGYWAGRTEMKPEDLGLKASDFSEDYFLGNIRLYPWAWHKAFAKLEGQARNWVGCPFLPLLH